MATQIQESEWKWEDHYPDEESYAGQMYSDAYKYCNGFRPRGHRINLDTVWDEISALYDEGNRKYNEEVASHYEHCVRTGAFPREDCFQCLSRKDVVGAKRNWQEYTSKLGFLGMVLYSKCYNMHY